MDLKALQREAHAIAREKGWWDEPRTFGDLIALVHSGLSEALEAYRGKHIWADWRRSKLILMGGLEVSPPSLPTW